MHIGIDTSVAGINQAGTGIYITALTAALRELHPRIQLTTFSVNQQRNMHEQKTLRSRLATVERDIVWTHVILPLRARRAQVDLLHAPANVRPVVAGCPTVVSILDTTIFQRPDHFPPWHRHYAHLFTPLAARTADRIITISEQSKQDIAQEFDVSPEKIDVTPLAAAPQFRQVAPEEYAPTIARYQLERYILTVGTLEPRKNLIRLLQAFAQLHRVDPTLRLVHSGPQGWLYDDILAEVQRLGIGSSVTFLGRVPLEELVHLYNAATVFVYPSLYEGFGLPVLEAMRCGCPVVTSNVSSLPEVAGTAAWLVNPYDVDALAAALLELTQHSERADILRVAGLARAQQFSWHRCALATAEVYAAALSL